MTGKHDTQSDTQAGNGAELFARLLVEFGASVVTMVPGEGLFELLDALARHAPAIELVSFRHEAGSVYAAQAIGQLSGLPGVCLAARAPGALNTCLAVHTAYTDSAPMLLIIGQASSQHAGREAFLGDHDLMQVFEPISKWVAQIPSAAQVGEFLSRAWQLALSGRRGPVVLILPEDVAAQPVAMAALPAPRVSRAGPVLSDVAALDAALDAASRPMLIVGGTGWDAETLLQLQRSCVARGLPIATTYRRRDLVDHALPVFCGEIGLGIDPALAAQIGEADLLIVLNARLGELNTIGAGAFAGYTLLEAPEPRQRLVHVYPDAADLNAVYRADLAIQSDANAFVSAWTAYERTLAPSTYGRASAVVPMPGRDARTPLTNHAGAQWALRGRRARDDFVASGSCAGPLDLRVVYAQLQEALGDAGLITSGAGGYALWPQRYLRHRRPGTQLGPKSGAMGYGLAAAIGAALLDRRQCAAESSRERRRIVALAGDGCFMMHAEELETAVRLGLSLLVLIVNNRSYGAIDVAQRRMFGRPTGTRLGMVDFAAFARSCGALGETVVTTDTFAPALARALLAQTVSVIELRVPEVVVKPGSSPPPDS